MTHHQNTASSASPWIGISMALLGFAIFSIADVLVKELSMYAPLQILFFSNLWAFVPVTVLLTLDATSQSLRPQNPVWVWLRGVIGVFSGVCVFYAFGNLPLTQVYALLFMTPLIMSLLSVPLLGESLGVHRLTAIILGFIGVMVVLRPGATDFSLAHAAGIGAAVCNSLNGILTRRVAQGENYYTMLLSPMLLNVLVAGAGLGYVYQPMDLGHMYVAAAMGTLMIAAQYCILQAYRRAPASHIAPVQYSQMLWAILYGSLLFGEDVDALTFVGAGIIVGSGLWIVWREKTVSAVQPNLATRSLRAVSVEDPHGLEKPPHDRKHNPDAPP